MRGSWLSDVRGSQQYRKYTMTPKINSTTEATCKWKSVAALRLHKIYLNMSYCLTWHNSKRHPEVLCCPGNHCALTETWRCYVSIGSVHLFNLLLASGRKANRFSTEEDGCPLMFSLAGNALWKSSCIGLHRRLQEGWLPAHRPSLFHLLYLRDRQKRWRRVLPRSENSASFWKGSRLSSSPLFSLSP